MYEGADLATYNPRGTHYYDLSASKMDREINNFTAKHKVISATPVTFVKGNNPPTPIIMYTIVYEETSNMTEARRNELDFVLDMIDMRAGTSVIFEVMTDQGVSKRKADDYVTGKAIVESWGDRIIGYEISEK